MFPHEGGELVILLLLESGVIDGAGVRPRVEPGGQVIQHRGIVEDAVHIAAPASLVQEVAVGAPVLQADQGGFLRVLPRVGATHVYLVTFAIHLVGDGEKRESPLPGDLLAGDDRPER